MLTYNKFLACGPPPRDRTEFRLQSLFQSQSTDPCRYFARLFRTLSITE
jgi:hypothetical protein